MFKNLNKTYTSLLECRANRMKPLIQEAVASLWKYTNTLRNVVITDLGCSAGPNAPTLVKTAADAIFHHCSDHKEMVPEISVLLNDLPDNDFNNVAKRLFAFQQSTQDFGHVFTAIVPGSFYKRLFTSNSVNLVLSSHSLNWLSKVIYIGPDLQYSVNLWRFT